MAFSETLIMAAANAAPRGVERLVRAVVTNAKLLAWTHAITQRTLRRVTNLQRIAVVSDTNIGDAVVLQGACAAFKRWLPACEIDFFYQQKAQPLLQANPFIDCHHPVFTDADFTSARNRRAVQASIRERHYDLILNLYPFLLNSELAGADCPILVPYRLVADIVRAESNPTETAHVAYHLAKYVSSIARTLVGHSDNATIQDNPGGSVLYLRNDVPARADQILRAAGVEENASIAFLNPDSSSRFSRIPLTLQVQVLQKLLTLRRFDWILLGPAYSFHDIPDQLCSQLAGHPGFQKLVRLPQNTPIDSYAGLIDRADLFITADTAQMHIAAARRVMPDSGGEFRNRTSLLTIFGATHSRIYGYDSFSSGYLDSNQNAPAKVFQGKPPCRNLTCIHKTRKNCRTVECFTGLDTVPLMAWIENGVPRPTDAAAPSATAQHHLLRSAVDAGAPEPIIVVSGLPRSGTSLMMQMLEAGGIEIATDGIRGPDADNPRGYYELERVKSLDRNGSWLRQCRGKAVKIISLLLSELPAQHGYRIIFMERSLPEILASQKKMLERRGVNDTGENEEELMASFRRHIASVQQALSSQTNVRVLIVAHRLVLDSPRQVAGQLSRFLDKDLHLDQMVRVVDATLHRHKDPTPHPAR